MKYQIIADLINKNNFRSYAEIGIWRGDNLKAILDLCPCLDALFGVDQYTPYSLKDGSTCSATDLKELNEIKRSLKDLFLNKDKVRFLFMPSQEAARYFLDYSLDIVFIDGNHEYTQVKGDILAWLPKVRSGGIICGHDYCDYYDGVKRAVNECFLSKEIEIKDFKVWVVKLRR